MEKPRPFLTLLLLLALTISTVYADKTKTYSKIKEFGQIIVTSQEALYLDLNEYFTGKIDSFSVDPPLSLPSSKFVQNSTQRQFYQGDANILSVDAPKDNFGNWDPNQVWVMLDSSNTLLTFTPSGAADNPTLAFTSKSQTPFYPADSTDYKCGSLMRNNPQTLVVSCLPISGGQVQYFFVDIASLTVSGSIPEPEFSEYTRSIQRFSAVPATIFITVPKADPAVASIISAYDITDPTHALQLKSLSGDIFGASSFVIQSVSAVANTSIYFAEVGGVIYRADHPYEKNIKTASFNLNDSPIMEMTVVFEAYHGTPQTILSVQTPSFIHTIDWTDINNPVVLSKYSLSPLKEPVKSIISLDLSQDFLSTIVSTASSSCRMLVYYRGPSLPGDVYLLQDCPMTTYQIKKERSTSSFFFLTGDKPELDCSIYQLKRSILTVQSSNIGQLSPSLSINGDFQEKLSVTVIDPRDYNVYLSNPSTQAYYGLTVPGKSTFDITSLLNGPFLNYSANDTNYHVVDPYTSLTFNGSSKDAIFAAYTGKNGSPIYWFSFDGTTTITLQTCTSKSTTAYTCDSNSVDLAGDTPPTVTAVAASNQYFYIYDSTNCVIKGYTTSLAERKDFTINGPKDDSGTCLACSKLLASQDPLAPFIYCMTNQNIYFARTDVSGVDMVSFPDNPCTGQDFTNSTIHVNHNFPSMLFFQCQKTIYILETFTWALSVPPVISTISVNDPKDQSFSFGVGKQSLLVLLKDGLTLTEYDISHPRLPILLKSLPFVDFYPLQILSDSQNSDQIYVYGRSAQTNQPLSVVYRPGVSANSNFLTSIALPNPPFDPSNPGLVFPTYPAFQLPSLDEIFLVPTSKQFGYTVKPSVLVNFDTKASSDPNATDYNSTVHVAFTGSHKGKTSGNNTANVSIDLILTDEPVRSTKSIVYTGVKLDPNIVNTIAFDPRNYFNGVITDYSTMPQDASEASKVQLIPQKSKGDSINLGIGNLNNLLIINQTFIAQTSTAVTLDTNGKIQNVDITTGYSCDNSVFNSYINEILVTCKNTKTAAYSFAFIQFTDTTPPVGPMLVTAVARKPIKNIQKIAFTASAIFVLENVEDMGSYIHIFSFSAPQTVTYRDSITGADLNMGSLLVTDFSINYNGPIDQYRIFLIDANSGLRSVDVYFNGTGLAGITNAQWHSLPSPTPANAVWNGISTVKEQGDLGLPVDLVVTSPNYKNYYLRYTAQTGVDVQVKRVFIPPPNTYITSSCYADGTVFLFSAYDGKSNYALMYYISNLTSEANGQNFPLLSLTYKATSQGACSFTTQAIEDGYAFYMSNGVNIDNYTLSPNIKLIVNGTMASDYITIYANSTGNRDSFNFYLVPPPDKKPSYLVLILSLAGLGVVIIIALLCYCNIKYRKNRDSTQEYRRAVDDDSFHENQSP